ncbi:MAG TPA: hypothetical protein VH475_08235 [Tepidisphaeraceae bacterium]|jgi:hypothetical protein
MAITITEDLVEGHRYFEDDKGADLTRVFRVDGLDSTTRIDTDAIYASDSTTGKGLPRPGDPHPTQPDFVMRQVDLAPPEKARNALWVRVRYVKVRRRLLDVRINGVSSVQDSFVDKTGRRMRVGYKGPITDSSNQLQSIAQDKPYPDPPLNDRGASGYEYSLAAFPKLVPESTLDIVYLEKSSPFKKNVKYGRKLNSKPWQGGEAREWLCESISGFIDSPIPRNLGQLGSPEVVTGAAQFDWIVTYAFRWKPKPKRNGSIVTDGEGWDPVELFVDAATGITPTDIDPVLGNYPNNKKGNGWAEFSIYDEIDFDELKLVSAIEVDPNDPTTPR